MADHAAWLPHRWLPLQSAVSWLPKVRVYLAIGKRNLLDSGEDSKVPAKVFTLSLVRDHVCKNGMSVYVRESASLACLIPATPLRLLPLPAALGLVMLRPHHPRLAAPAAWALGQVRLLILGYDFFTSVIYAAAMQDCNRLSADWHCQSQHHTGICVDRGWP